MYNNIKLNVTFSDEATGCRAEKIWPNHWNIQPFGYTYLPAVGIIGKDVAHCDASEKTHPSTSIEYLTDCAKLSAVALRKRYPGEANSHRNMLSRQKTKGATVHPCLKVFESFLRTLGPKPTKKSTLDRINNNDPEYAPGKVRWADKCTQNGNKGDSLTFHCPQTNEVYTTSRLSKLQGVAGGTIRTRRSRGWSDAEIINGKKQKMTAPAVSTNAQPTWKSQNHFSLPLTEMTAGQIQFERDRQSVLSDRAEFGGVDYLHPTPTEMLAEIQESADRGSLQSAATLAKPRGELLERLTEFFIRTWRSTYRPHVELERLDPKQRLYIEQIDPDWVAEQKSKLATKVKYATEL